MKARPARPADAAAIARIFNEGIQDRVATFETEPRTEEDILGWITEGDPIVVSEADGEVVAWAAAHEYRPRACYTGVGDYSIYVARERRGTGLGRPTLAALVEECERRGYWKLLARIFPENEASLALARAVGFREVGVYRRHGKLDGEWRDCVVVEKLLGEAAAEFPVRSDGQAEDVGENFPEGTSASDPSAVPRTEQTTPEDESPRRRDEDEAIGPVGRDDPEEETDAEETPESQQAG